jgi:hypothetical protein
MQVSNKLMSDFCVQAIVVRSGQVNDGGTFLPVGLQLIGRPFGYCQSDL